MFQNAFEMITNGTRRVINIPGMRYLLGGAAAIASAAMAGLAYLVARKWLQSFPGNVLRWRMRLISWLLSRSARRFPSVRALRDEVRKAPMYTMDVSSLNKHGHSAAARRAADWYIMLYASRQGRGVWSLSQSALDIERGVPGERLYYDPRDLTMEMGYDPLNSRDVVKLIDVDYYVEEADIARFVSRGHTVAMYTIIPESVNVSGHDYTGRFVSRDELEMMVDGGKPYRHKLWDWNRDSVSVCDAWSSTRCYVETKRVDKHRYVVFLIPVLSHSYLPSWLAGWWYEDRITRVDVGDPVRMLSLTNPPRVSIGAPDGGVLAVDVPRAVFDELKAIKAVNGAPLVPGSVERILVARKVDTTGVALVTLAVNDGRSLPIKPDTNAVSGRHYQCVWAERPYDEGKQKGRFFTKPLIDGAFSAQVSKSNDIACIHGRVEKMRNEIPRAQTDPELHAQYLAYMDEFLEMLIPEPGLGVPVDMSVVNEKQSRRSQRVSLANEETLAVPPLEKDLEAFQKAESYPKLAWPRNITNVDANHRVNYSRFIYAATEQVKKTASWYAFGLRPEQVAEKVRLLAMLAPILLEGDFSKWDGTLPHLLRLLERKFGMRFFSPEYVDEFVRLHERLVCRAGRTEKGVRYWTGSSRLSGGADTSLFNTVLDGFLVYCAKRLEGRSPEEAWANLGIFGGDDNLSDAKKECLELVCADLGLTIKIIVREAGSAVGFLGRYWTNPWEHEGSCFDVYRALSKFHYTHKNDPTETRAMILWRKAVCLWVTDSQTPVLGCLARNILRLIPSGCLGEVEHQHWVKEATESIRWDLTQSENIMRKFSEPMFPFVDTPDLSAWVMDNLNCSADAIMGAEFAWDNAMTVDDIFRSTPWFEAKPLTADTAVMIGGEIIKPDPSQSIPNQPTIAPIPARRPICPIYTTNGACDPACTLAHVDCKNYVAGRCDRKGCKFRHIGLVQDKVKLILGDRPPKAHGGGAQGPRGDPRGKTPARKGKR